MSVKSSSWVWFLNSSCRVLFSRVQRPMNHKANNVETSGSLTHIEDPSLTKSKAMGGIQQCSHRIIGFCKICKSRIFNSSGLRPLTLCTLTLTCFLSHFPCVGDIGVIMEYLGSAFGAVTLEKYLVWVSHR